MDKNEARERPQTMTAFTEKKKSQNKTTNQLECSRLSLVIANGVQVAYKLSRWLLVFGLLLLFSICAVADRSKYWLSAQFMIVLCESDRLPAHWIAISMALKIRIRQFLFLLNNIRHVQSTNCLFVNRL